MLPIPPHQLDEKEDFFLKKNFLFWFYLFPFLGVTKQLIEKARIKKISMQIMLFLIYWGIYLLAAMCFIMVVYPHL